MAWPAWTLAGLDLQVGHRIGAGSVGQHEVAVDLVGVGADGAGADEHVTDPDGMGLLALQRRLVGHPAAARRQLVVDEEAVLVVLAGIGEGEAEKFSISTGTGEPDGRAEPHEVTAQGRHDVPVTGVASHQPGVRADVHRIVGPVLQRDDRDVSAVTGDDLHARTERSGADVVEDDRRAGERPTSITRCP